MEYEQFLKSKLQSSNESGIEISKSKINKLLFNFQKDIVRWSLKKGKSAIFSMTGTGKTIMQIEFADQITKCKNIRALIVAPLAVSNQTQKIALDKFNIKIQNLRHHEKIGKINIVNYEQLENIDTSQFECVVLDESSILKNYSGKMRKDIIDRFSHYPYKLACTATPAPNDYMELGNHSEFLNIMSRNEMLSMFFIHDSSDTQKWRLKGHAESKYWEWVASWAAIMTKPSDLGYENDGFILPPLNVKEEIIHSSKIPEGHLFQVDAKTLNERRQARRESTDERVARAAEIINNSDEIFIAWCDLNYESEMLAKMIKDSVEVKGSNSIDHKEKSMIDFSDGKIKCLVTKPSICGFGMNFQICHNQIFVGLSDSFEQYFQAVRRCWRFGQTKPVNVDIIISDTEGAVLDNIKRKENDSEKMISGMIFHTRKYIIDNIHTFKNKKELKNHDIKMMLPKFMEVSL